MTRALLLVALIGCVAGPALAGQAIGPVIANPRVTCDRWPNHYDAKSWIADVWRLSSAKTGEEKAVALYKWTRRQLHWGDQCHDGTRGTRQVTIDAIKKINVHPYGYCVDFGIVAAALGHAGGMKCMESHVPGHTQLEVFYRDKDGVERWHRFDPFWGVTVYDKTGSHIATWQEIKADPNVALKPAKTLLPWGDKKDDRTRYAQKGAARPSNRVRPCRHTMDKPLYAGEVYTLRWDRDPRVEFVNANPKCRNTMKYWGMQRYYYARGDLDKLAYGHEDLRPYLVKAGKQIQVPPAHGILEFTPRLDANFADSLYAPPINVAVGGKDEPKLKPADPKKPMELIYLVQTPYVIAASEFRGLFRGNAKVSFAYGQWRRNKWTLEQVVPAKPRWKVLSNSRGKGPFLQVFTVDDLKLRGEYKVLVKVELSGTKTFPVAGIDDLRFGLLFQEGIMALPRLMPGKNVISVAAGKIKPGYKLRVEYCWDDTKGKGHKAAKLFEKLPATFDINAAGKRPADVRTRYLTIAPVGE